MEGRKNCLKQFRQSGGEPLLAMVWLCLSGRNYQLASIINISYKTDATFEITTTLSFNRLLKQKGFDVTRNDGP